MALGLALAPCAELNPTPTGLRPMPLPMPAAIPASAGFAFHGALFQLERDLDVSRDADYRAPVLARFQVPPLGIWGAPRHYGGHQGVDLAAAEGTPVRAARAGRVLRAHAFNLLLDYGRGYGGLVIVVHPDGSRTWYSHLGRIAVKAGDRVARGTKLGSVGGAHNGDSSGPHLHFMLFGPDGRPRDPSGILPPGAFPSSSSVVGVRPNRP